MDFNELLKQKKISKYKLSKESGVPYSTISDISTGKSKLEKCSAETLIRLCHVMNMSVEELFPDIVYPEIKKKTVVKKQPTKKTSIENQTNNKTVVEKQTKNKTAVEKQTKNKTVVEKQTNKTQTEIKANLQQAPHKIPQTDEIDLCYEDSIKSFYELVDEKMEELGQLPFLIENIKRKAVDSLYEKERIDDCKYLLEILDQLCVMYHFPMLKEYDYIRYM